MARQLPRNLGPVASLDAGQWTAETASGRPAISCPSCSAISDLPETHHVLAGGFVSPAWSCPRCSYVSFLGLEAHGEDVLG